ncbi:MULTISPECIES: helix-turn-helix domain-containing protein [unclassified Candidatus Tisiphia]|uniref:helix-turn-helix domain-containing protein n=1 Tax=unclassified Candidatus Tisiphia TaxID=2996318 RepID=UPI0035C90628
MARKNQYIKQVDQLIGGKISSLRLAKDYTRQQLADLIEVTHQQLQKYEKGINRISTGRLMLIAKALDENIDYFLEGLKNTGSAEPVLTQHQRICIEVSRNFMKIRNPKHQQAVNTLVHSLIIQETSE